MRQVCKSIWHIVQTQQREADLDPGWGGGHDLGLTGSLWPQVKELLKKVEQLSEEVLAVRGENARLASQLRVCLVPGGKVTAREEGGQGKWEDSGNRRDLFKSGPGWASDGSRETLWPS